jgi:hypothetical protein
MIGNMPKRKSSKSNTTTKIGPSCIGRTSDDGQCKSPRLSSSQYCFFHDPDLTEERKAAQSAGGQRNTIKVLPASTPDVKLGSAEDQSKFLEETMSQVRRGELDPKVANTLGYLFSLHIKIESNLETDRRISTLESLIKRQRQNGSFNSNAADEHEWIPPSGEKDNAKE